MSQCIYLRSPEASDLFFPSAVSLSCSETARQCCTGQSSSSHPVVHELQPGRSFPLCAGFCAPGFALAVPVAETNNDTLVSSLGSSAGSRNFHFHLDNCFCRYS